MYDHFDTQEFGALTSMLHLWLDHVLDHGDSVCIFLWFTAKLLTA